MSSLRVTASSENVASMSVIAFQSKFDRLAGAIARVRATCDGGSESANGQAELQGSLAELEAALQAIRERSYRPSQRDAVAALELAADLVQAGQGPERDPEAAELETLIRVGLDRLKCMGL